MRTGADRTLELLTAQVGRSIHEVETPVAMVDLDRLEAEGEAGDVTELGALLDRMPLGLAPVRRGKVRTLLQRCAA